MKDFKITRDKLISALLAGNFRFRYGWIENFGEYNHKHLFIIGERSDKSGIEAIEEIRRGQRAGELRIWYVDLELPEANRYLHNIPYEYPLPLSPVAIAYDGQKYLYVIYNKYNIWRLNLKGVLNQPNESWWMRLPPCLNCNFLGDTRTDDIWDTYFIEPNYLALISKDGRMARMDTETFVWFLDKASPPEMAVFTNNDRNNNVFDENMNILVNSNVEEINNVLGTAEGNEVGKLETNNTFMTVHGLDNNELYMCNFGGIGGKVMNVYDKQWDNFYFDTRVCGGAVKYFSKAIDLHLFPMFVKRRRLYTVNEIGHIFYAWLRIYGEYDVEFQLNDFYQGDEVRIYMDYTTIQYYNNTQVSVYAISSGWVDIDSSHFTPNILETDWLWDSEYLRQYVKIYTTPDGNLSYRYSKTPPIYLSVDISYLNQPISKIRVKYKPEPKEYNYVCRINKVELITNQETLNLYDSSYSSTPLDIIRLEPITTEQDYSSVFGVWVRNNSDHTIEDVKVYVKNDRWVQITTDYTIPESWALYDEKHPLELGDIDPHNEIVIYIRGMNIDDTPHTEDLVIIGIYPYNI